MEGSELERRLREWARLSSAPLEAPPRDRPPSAEQVAARLREATELWRTCARLGELRSR